MGTRPTFGLTVMELAKKYNDFLVLAADVRSSAGLEPFYRNFPDRYFDIGIAEQNMIGISAGFASEGFHVITTTFAPFQTMRCCEQIRVNLGYMQQNVCMVGLASGLVLGTQGFTHCCFEDVAVLRGIPNLTIISPADCGELVKTLFAAMEHKQAIYIRLTGGQRNPIVFQDDYDFEIGKAITLREGNNVTIIACGTMVHASLEAAKILETENNIFATVINMHTIKPIDKEVIEKACKTTDLIVTIEEHNVIGGLGSAVAEYKSTLQNSPPQLFLGIPDTFCKPGDYQYLLNHFGLTPEKIAQKIKTTLIH
jgi:transketolase